MKIKIGYQGVEYSNNYFAAIEFAKTQHLNDFELIPLISSANVVNALEKKSIDFGLMATQNNTVGIVNESFEATLNKPLELVDTVILSINHTIFLKNENIIPSDIKQIISHEMALKQCKDTLSELFPTAKLISASDSAITAELLATDYYDENTAIICNMNAGIKYNLYPFKKNAEDSSENQTEFRLYKIRENFQNNSIMRRILFFMFDNKFVDFSLKIGLILLIFSGFYIKEYFNWTNLDFALNIGPILVTFFYFVTSKKFQTEIKDDALVGYWIYNAVSENSIDDNKQRYVVPRMVKITKEDGIFNFTGYIADSSSSTFFETYKTVVSERGKKKGTIIYWYKVKDINTAKYRFSGVAFLDWRLKNESEIITKMEGEYFGNETKDKGSLQYIRISKKEFDHIKKLIFLSPSTKLQ